MRTSSKTPEIPIWDIPGWLTLDVAKRIETQWESWLKEANEIHRDRVTMEQVDFVLYWGKKGKRKKQNWDPHEQVLTHIQEHNTSASISTAADAEARTTMARVREIVEEICFSSHKRTIATVSTVFTLLLSSVGALTYKVLEIDETPGAEQSVPEDIEPVPEASSKSDDTVLEDFVAPKNDTSWVQNVPLQPKQSDPQTAQSDVEMVLWVAIPKKLVRPVVKVDNKGLTISAQALEDPKWIEEITRAIQDAVAVMEKQEAEKEAALLRGVWAKTPPEKSKKR